MKMMTIAKCEGDFEQFYEYLKDNENFKLLYS